jgi:fibronectin type 3 domain-containing protein
VLGNVSTFTDTGLVNGVIYSYNISATNKFGEGPKSIGVVAVLRTVPTAPRSLQATPGNGRIVLTWLVPASDGGTPIIDYSIYRGTTAGSEILFVIGYPGGTSWVDTNVTVGTKYYYMVSAVNVAGEGPKSNEQNATAGASPGVPTGLTASGGNTQVLLRWSTPISGGTPARYNIYRSDSQTGIYTFIASSNTTEYRDKGLTNGHEYWYKLNAQNQFGISGNTNAVSATPYGTSIISSLLLILIIVIIVIIVIAETMRTSRKKKPSRALHSKKRNGPV